MAVVDVTRELEHHLPLGGGWAVWRWICVRGAGFPARQVLQLAAPRSASAADARAQSDEKAAAASDRFHAALSASADPQLRRWRRRRQAAQRLRDGRPPDEQVAEAVGDELVTGFRRAHEQLERSRATLERALESDSAAVSERLRATVSAAPFAEALLWQNARAYRTALLPYLAGGPRGKQLRRERMLALYLQRYAVKNDSIGFFGPFGWGALVSGRGDTRAEPGPALLARRTVYFEHWCVDALAAALSRDESIKLQVAPRRSAALRVDGDRLDYGGRPLELPEDVAALLAACDGSEPAQATAARLVADGVFDSDDELFQLLEQLEDLDLITWRLDVPVFTIHPDDHLRDAIARLEGAAGSRARAALDELEAGRQAVAAAAGDAPALERALGDLDDSFVQRTGAEPVRSHGRAYAGRTLVYEDCRRDFDLRLDSEFLAPLDLPLRLVFRSARWYTHAVASRYRTELTAAFRRLAGPGEAVDYPRFHREILPLLPTGSGDGDEIVSEVVSELHRRWRAILAPEPDASRVTRSAGEIAGQVDEAFEAPHPGWPGARLLSPDLLIAAGSFADVAAGRGIAVLGELHTCNTMTTPAVHKEHVAPGDLLRAYELDVPDARIEPVIPGDRIVRAHNCSLSPRDWDLEAGLTRSWRPRQHVLTAAELVVEEIEGNLVVRPRDDRVRFDVIAFFESQLTRSTRQRFSLIEDAEHVPRVAIDSLVVAREQWRFHPESIPAALDSGAAQFSGFRRWARDHAIPRFVFVKTPEETKPVYVDFDSPLLLEIFARLVRKASRVDVSEMLPSVQDCWLPDAAGNTYSCELRMVAVDPEPWRPPGGD